MVIVLWLKRTGVKFLPQHAAPCGLKSNQYWCNFTYRIVYDANWKLHHVLQFNVANKTAKYCEPVYQNWMINVLKEDSFADRM